MQRFLLLIFLAASSSYSFCQQIVSGFVFDQANDLAISGAMVTCEVDTTITDVNGLFRFDLVNTPTQLTVSSLGYEKLTLDVSDKKNIRISLVPEVKELNQVIVSSGLSSSKIIDAATSISTINQMELRRDHPFSFSSSMNRVSGVFMHAGTLNTNRITIRGIGSRSLFSTNQVRAYLDQIPLTDGSGNSSLEDIDQSLIERISIIKGPNASIYGAGLGGVIQLNSSNPAFNETSAESSLTVGSFGTSRWLNKLSHNDEKISLNVIHTDVQSDGYRNNNELKRTQVGVIGKVFLKDNNHLSFLAMHTDMFAQIPSSINEEDYRLNPRLAAANWQEAQGFEDYKRNLIGLNYNYTIHSIWNLSHAISLQTRDTYEPAPGPFVNIQDENLIGFSSRHLATAQFDQLTISGGFEWFIDHRAYREFENLHTPTSNGSVKGAETDQFKETRSFLNTFGELSVELNQKLKLVAGLNINKTQYQLEDQFSESAESRTGDYSFGTIVSPRVGSVVHFSDKMHWFSNISHGFSPPSLEQTLLPDGQINPEIRPETGWNFESGLRGDIKGFSYDISVYYMNIRNLLVGRRTEEDVYIGVNAGKNQHLGADISINYVKRFLNNSSLRVFQNTTLAHFRFKDFVDDGADFSGNQLTGVPSINLTGGLELITYQGFYGNVNAQYTGEMPITDDNSIYSEAYLILRTRMGYRKSISKFDIDLSFGVDNIGNKKYASMLLINSGPQRYYYPGLPRNYFGGLSLKYNFN